MLAMELARLQHSQNLFNKAAARSADAAEATLTSHDGATPIVISDGIGGIFAI
jgi:hypothetical protein